MSDIDTLEKAMRDAFEAGDLESAERYALAYKELKKGNVTRAGAAGKSVARGFGKIRSGMAEAITLANMDSEGRRKIAETERIKEMALEPYREAYPATTFIGESVAPTLLTGGRSIPSTMLRGGLTGALSYTPDMESRALQSGLMASLGPLGQQMSLTRGLGNRASSLGMKATPEESSLTFLPKSSVGNLQAFRTQAFKAAKYNQERITRKALEELGEGGTKFTDDTIANAEKNAGKLFKEAIGSREILIVPRSKLAALDDFSVPKGTRSAGRKAAAAYAKEIQDLVSKNGNMSIADYQRIRSEITDEIISATKGKKKRALGEVIDWLDDQAETNFSQETLRKFREGRKLWKNYSLYKRLAQRRGGIDYETGMLDPNKLEGILLSKDTGGFLLNKNPSAVYDMIRVNRQLAGHADVSARSANNLGSLRVGLGGQGQGSIGYYSNRLINEPLGALGLSLNRLPGDLITDIPSGVVPAMNARATEVPLLRPNIPSAISAQDDPSDELVIRR